jgi:hypothetical protein
MQRLSALISSTQPLLRSLCLREIVVDLTGLETLLLSENSKITELEIHRSESLVLHPLRGLPRVLKALARRRTLTKLGLRMYALGRRGETTRTVLYTPSLRSLDLARNGRERRFGN